MSDTYQGELLALGATVLLGLVLVVGRSLLGGPLADGPLGEPLLLDANRAGPAELTALPGVGRRYAARIVAGRPYADLEELRPILGERLFAGARPYLFVAPRDDDGAAPPRGPTWPKSR